MLADYVGVDVVRVHAAVGADEAAKSGRVQRRARTEDPAGGGATRGSIARGQVGHHVHRVGGHHQDRLGSMGEYLRHDFRENTGVAPK